MSANIVALPTLGDASLWLQGLSQSAVSVGSRAIETVAQALRARAGLSPDAAQRAAIGLAVIAASGTVAVSVRLA